MSVPEWKRNIDEQLKVLTYASEIRYNVDNLIFRKFWVKDMNKAIRRKYRPKPDENAPYDEYEYFFKEEQRILSTLFANLQANITGANSIHPYYKNEYLMRRNYHNRTIVNIFQIKSELNHIVTIAYVNVNKYTELINSLDEELRMLIAWKRSLKKFKKNLVDL